MTIGATLFIAAPERTLLRTLLAVLSVVHAIALASAVRHVPGLLSSPDDRSAFRPRVPARVAP